MVIYIIRKAAFAFIVAIRAVGYYLWKNDRIVLPEREWMKSGREELIASAKKRYGDADGKEAVAWINEKLLSMASISAMTADAAMQKQNPEAYMRAVAAYGESAELVSQIDKMMALRYTFMKGRALCQFRAFFPDDPQTPEAVQKGVAIIEGVMKEWDREKDAELWHEMKAILKEHKGTPE